MEQEHGRYYLGLGLRDITPIIKNQMEENITNEVETFFYKGLYGLGLHKQ